MQSISGDRNRRDFCKYVAVSEAGRLMLLFLIFVTHGRLRLDLKIEDTQFGQWLKAICFLNTSEAYIMTQWLNDPGPHPVKVCTLFTSSRGMPKNETLGQRMFYFRTFNVRRVAKWPLCRHPISCVHISPRISHKSRSFNRLYYKIKAETTSDILFHVGLIKTSDTLHWDYWLTQILLHLHNHINKYAHIQTNVLR